RGDGAPVGLVFSVGRSIRRSCGELRERIRNADQTAVKRQLAAELVQFVEIVIEGAAALGPQCGPQYALGNKRIAVAVAADPAAQPEKRGEAPSELHACTGELLFQVGVEPRQS